MVNGYVDHRKPRPQCSVPGCGSQSDVIDGTTYLCATHATARMFGNRRYAG